MKRTVELVKYRGYWVLCLHVGTRIAGWMSADTDGYRHARTFLRGVAAKN